MYVYLKITPGTICRMLDISALGQIGTKTNRHLRRNIDTETNRNLDKSAPDFRQIGTFTDKSALWKILMYFHVYSTFSKKNSQILVNEDRSICLPIVGEISQSTIFPRSATFFIIT
jgi:hypothetical protein